MKELNQVNVVNLENVKILDNEKDFIEECKAFKALNDKEGTHSFYESDCPNFFKVVKFIADKFNVELEDVEEENAIQGIDSDGYPFIEEWICLTKLNVKLKISAYHSRKWNFYMEDVILETNSLEEQLRKDVQKMLSSIISDDYYSYIAGELVEDVVLDVKETSAFEDEGYYNVDDIRLAFGRVLLERLNIENS